VGIVLAAGSYPDAPGSGDAIDGIDAARAIGALVFHAGTRRDDGRFVTNGGRVLTVIGRGSDLGAARAVAESAADAISWPGMHRRHDIGAERVAAGAGR
jgi:phosphoribosylamine---glycine ligase